MKLKLIAGLLLTLSNVSVSAQKGLPSFGRVSPEEILLKDCPFEPGVEAMYLYDAAEATIGSVGDDFTFETVYTVRIKIFNEKGFAQADVKIPFYEEGRYESISNISAYTYNLGPDGKVQKKEVDKKLIYKEKLNKFVSSMTFTFPEVKVGSVLEYKYYRVRKSIVNIDSWAFQTRLPVAASHYELNIPEYFNFSKQIVANLPLDKKEEKVNQQYRYYYTMRDIPGLRDEPYMGARKDYLQRIDFQLNSVQFPNRPLINVLGNWQKINQGLLENDNFGKQLRKNVGLPDDLKIRLTTAGTQFEKLKVIHDYIRQRFEWNGEEDIYTDGVKAIMGKKGGTNADLNLLLINLLRDQNIECYPMLVSTRDNGKVLQFLPLISQFNKVIVLAMVADNYYVINAADRYNPLELIPYDVLGTSGFVVDKEKSGFVGLWDSRMVKKHIVNINAVAGTDNQITGKASISSSGYARAPLVMKYKEKRADYISQYASAGDSKIKIDTVIVNNLEIDTLPFLQELKYSLPVNNAEGYHYFTVNMFSGLEKNPFLAEKRFTEVDFGFNQFYQITGTIRLPEGFQMEEVPKNLRMIMPDTSIVFSRLTQVIDESILQFRIQAEFKKAVYTMEEYDSFKEFYKQLFTLLNEQYVYRKKDN